MNEETSLLDTLQAFYANYLAAGLVPGAEPSHLLIRSKTAEDFAAYTSAIETEKLGEPIINAHSDGRTFMFLQLKEALTCVCPDQVTRLCHWAEFSPPDDTHVTGIEALVFFQPDLVENKKVPFADGRHVYSYRNKSIAQILEL